MKKKQNRCLQKSENWLVISERRISINLYHLWKNEKTIKIPPKIFFVSIYQSKPIPNINSKANMYQASYLMAKLENAHLIPFWYLENLTYVSRTGLFSSMYCHHQKIIL